MSEDQTNRRTSEIYHALAKALYLAAGLVILIWFLYLIERVLLASVLALILAVALNAPVSWMERRNVSRAAGTGIAFMGLLLVFGGIGWLVIPRLGQEIPVLIEQVPELIENLTDQITAVIGDHPEVERQMDRVIDWVFNAFEGMWQYADVMAGAVVMFIFLLALVLYMVANLRPILQWYVKSMPVHLRQPATRAFARASEMVIGWVIASVILGSIKSVAAFAFLTFMEVPGAIVWSVIAFLGAFVPRVGFYFMTIPPVLVAFTVDPMTALWTLIFYVSFSELLGNFVAPPIYAETMKINAVFILIITVAMGYAFGVIGVLIAAPIAGFMKAYYDEFYLARQPDDPHLDERVEVMIARNVDGSKVQKADAAPAHR